MCRKTSAKFFDLKYNKEAIKNSQDQSVLKLVKYD